MTDPKQTLRYPAGDGGRGARRLALLPDAAARAVQDRQLRQGARAGHPDHRGGRGGQPPPRRRADLPAGRRRPVQPRRRRRHQPRRRPGPADLGDRRRARRRGRLRARSRPSSWRSTCRTPRRCKPFWAAVLGYDRTTASGRRSWTPAAATTRCGSRRRPDATGEVQQRFHLDIVVPREVAEERVAGRPRRRRHPGAPSDAVPAFWVLADAHGNKVCVCTADGRESDWTRHGSPETAVPYGGTAGHSDDGRSGERLPWLHAPGPSRTHATCRLSRPTQHARHPSLPSRAEGFFVGQSST